MRYRRRISPATHLIMGQDTGVMTGMFSSRPASCTFRLSEPNRTRFYRSPNVQSSRRSKAYHPLVTRVKSLSNRTLIYRHMSEPTLIRRSDTDRLRFRTLRRVCHVTTPDKWKHLSRLRIHKKISGNISTTSSSAGFVLGFVTTQM